MTQTDIFDVSLIYVDILLIYFSVHLSTKYAEDEKLQMQPIV